MLYRQTDLQLLEQRWSREFQPLPDSAALRGSQLVHLVCSLVHFFDAVRLNRARDRYVRLAINEATHLRRFAIRSGRIGEASYWLKLEMLLRVDGFGFNLVKLQDRTSSQTVLEQAGRDIEEQGGLQDSDLLSTWVLAHLHLVPVRLEDNAQAGRDRAQSVMDSVAKYEEQVNPFVRIRYLNQRAQLELLQGRPDTSLAWLNRGERLLVTMPVISHTEQIDHYFARRIGSPALFRLLGGLSGSYDTVRQALPTSH
ncbi:MAG: hypothetical protein UZ13_01060 [Chloroflexi bacterium OLB13]|nr:MAG: hypothetical protein UZ13_01060 [Chloroflexi bacterium OLB13]